MTEFCRVLSFHVFIYMRDNLSNFPFAFLYTKPLLKGVYFKRKKNCFQGDPFSHVRQNKFDRVAFLERVSVPLMQINFILFKSFIFFKTMNIHPMNSVRLNYLECKRKCMLSPVQFVYLVRHCSHSSLSQ